MKWVVDFLKDFSLKTALLLGVLLLSFYVFYRFQLVNTAPYLIVLSLILLLAESHTVFHLYGMFYSLWPRKYVSYDHLNQNRNLQINLFICICGEPIEVVRETILAAKKAADNYNLQIKPYRPAQVVVLNDGLVAKKENWELVKNLAESLGVRHLARTIPGGFKAGNINNGLKLTPTFDSHNTLDVVFDSDFAAHPDFLLEITKPFVDSSVDFVQSPQRYKNETTWVAKAAAAHQIFFFDHICKAKGHDNALFLCGTNFAIRRSALNAVNGMDDRFITEDYATSLNLHLKGHKGVFLPKVLAEGVAPASLKQYFNQQQRWSKGNFDVTRKYFKELLVGKLTIKQKFHYILSASYYLIGLRDLILILAPLPYLLFGVSLVKANTLQFLFIVYGPLLIYNLMLYAILFRHPLKSLVLDISSFPVFTQSFFSSLLKKDLSFIVTIKKYEKENPFSVYRVQLIVVAILFWGLYVGIQNNVAYQGSLLNYFWAIFDVVILSFGFYLIARENWNLETFEEIYFSIHNRLAFLVNLPTKVIPRAAYLLLLVSVIGGLLATTTYFRSFARIGIESVTLKETPKLPAKELLVPQNGVYYGYYLASLNSHPETVETSLITGEETSLVMFYQDWNSQSGFDTAFMNRLAGNNLIPVITWEPWDSQVEGEEGVNQTQFTPQKILAGDYDGYIHRWARQAANYGQPFFLRFAHEMNGNWYPWGGQEPETFIKLWQHVHAIFEMENADNVIWVWSPNNTNQSGDNATILDFYPGDNYVDWVAFSGFNWGKANERTSWHSFKEVAYEAYAKLATLNKPVMVAETSSVSKGGNKEAWFRQTLTSDILSLPQIKAVIFFNEDFGTADFKLDSGMDVNKVIPEYLINSNYYLKSPVLVDRQ